MRVIPINAIPVYLSESGAAVGCPPAIRFFDVYYTCPPIVGLHVVGLQGCYYDE